MYTRLFRRLMCVTGILLAPWVTFAADLTDWLPADVNAVVSVNVTGLYESPLAKRENWSAKARDAFVQQEVVIPPGLKEFVVGAELDLENHLEPLRTFSIAAPTPGVTLEALSALAGGTPFSLDNHSAVQTHRGDVVVQAAPTTWIGVRQGGRQAALRWLKSRTGKPSTSDLGTLRTALSQRNPKAQIGLAIDLTNAVSATAADRLLGELPDKLTDAKRAKLASLLASAEFVVLGVTVDNDIRGVMHIELGSAAADLSPVLKSLVPAVLQSLGMTSEELEGLTWTTKGNALVGTGELSAPETRRILSIVQHATASLAATTSPGEVSTESTNRAVVIATQRYLKSMRTILDDLRKITGDNYALWFERGAGKIDDLPMKNVDPELLDYSQKVSNSLRYQSQMLRSGNIRGGVVKAQTGAGNTYRNAYGLPYGGYLVQQDTAVSPGAITAAANQGARELRFSEWKQIDDGLVQVRRKLSEKLMSDF